MVELIQVDLEEQELLVKEMQVEQVEHLLLIKQQEVAEGVEVMERQELYRVVLQEEQAVQD